MNHYQSIQGMCQLQLKKIRRQVAVSNILLHQPYESVQNLVQRDYWPGIHVLHAKVVWNETSWGLNFPLTNTVEE